MAPKRRSSSSSCPSGGGKEVMVFHPTWEEFVDFNKYIEFIEKSGATKMGVAKIIPPVEYKPRKKEEDATIWENIIIEPLKQTVRGKAGFYLQSCDSLGAMTVKAFREVTESSRYQCPEHADSKDLDKKYRADVRNSAREAVYGADVEETLMDPDLKEWNLNRLPSILSHLEEDYGQTYSGVTSPYLYFGCYKSTFAWHTEDMDLYSINYLHFGAPKRWYAIPSSHGKQFEKVLAAKFPKQFQACRGFMRHKMILASPHVIEKACIPCFEVTQKAGEFIVTFPFAYHSGYNQGFNCAEAVNFATPRWVQYGKFAKHCRCDSNLEVTFNMDTYVHRYQTEMYPAWQNGNDYSVCPQDPTDDAPAPGPSVLQFATNSRNFTDPRQQEVFKKIVEASRGEGGASMEPNDPPTEPSKSEKAPEIPPPVPASIVKEKSKIFFRGIDKDASVERVTNFFMKFGHVQQVSMLLRWGASGSKTEHRGSGFVTFNSADAAQRVFDEAKKPEQGFEKIVCEWAKEKSPLAVGGNEVRLSQVEAAAVQPALEPPQQALQTKKFKSEKDSGY